MRLPEMIVTAFHGISPSAILELLAWAEPITGPAAPGSSAAAAPAAPGAAGFPASAAAVDDVRRVAALARRIDSLVEAADYELRPSDRELFRPEPMLQALSAVAPHCPPDAAAFVAEATTALRDLARQAELAEAWQRFLAGGEFTFEVGPYDFETPRPPTCSFCGKGQSEVRKLIAGPTCYICDECISLCQEIVTT